MDKAIQEITATPSKPDLPDAELAGECNHLKHSVLNKIPANTLASDYNGTNSLDLLNPGLNTLGFVFVLCAKIDVGNGKAIEANLEHFKNLLENYDPRQTKHAAAEFRRVVEKTVEHCSTTGTSSAIVQSLQRAILRATNPTTFSFLHVLFTQICLEAHAYRDAIPVLDIDIFDFPASKGYKDGNRDVNFKGHEVSYQDVLKFFLYGGMCYLAVKNWRRALECFQYCIAHPGNGTSTIQLEAYKKFILTGLILDGKIHSIPKSVHQQCHRIYKALTKPYEAFAVAFISRDPEVFAKEAAQIMQVFESDFNGGLARQCMESFRRQQIIALQDIYVTLGVDEIAAKKFDVSGRAGGNEETERVILDMIERGELHAELSHTDTGSGQTSTVHFLGPQPIDASASETLQVQVQRIKRMSEQVEFMDRKLGLTKEYIQFASKNGGKNMGGNFGGHMSGFGFMDDQVLDDYDNSWADEMDTGMMDDSEITMHDYDEL